MYAESLRTLEFRLEKALQGVFLTRRDKLLQMEFLVEQLRKTNEKFSKNTAVYAKDKKKLIKRRHGLRVNEILAIRFKDGYVMAKVLDN